MFSARLFIFGTIFFRQDHVGTSCMGTYIVLTLSISVILSLYLLDSLIPCYSVSLLPCSLVTLLLCFLVTLLPCYSVFMLLSLLPCYLVTLLPCYLVTLKLCYLVTLLACYLDSMQTINPCLCSVRTWK